MIYQGGKEEDTKCICQTILSIYQKRVECQGVKETLLVTGERDIEKTSSETQISLRLIYQT